MAETKEKEDGEIEGILRSGEPDESVVLAARAHGDRIEKRPSSSSFPNGVGKFSESAGQCKPASNQAVKQYYQQENGGQSKPRITSGVEPIEQRCHDDSKPYTNRFDVA
jgi:hypothetical protein